MNASQSKPAVEDADSQRSQDERCDPGPRGSGEAMAMRPRVLIVTTEEPIDYPLHQALEAECDVRWASTHDDSLDTRLRDADMAVVDWSTLGRIVAEATHQGCPHGTWADSPVGVDLGAVVRLGTILKSLSAGSRIRRRRIN
jgi:hypothetical protein